MEIEERFTMAWLNGSMNVSDDLPRILLLQSEKERKEHL